MCSPSSKKLCGSTTCEICLPRSFASHPRATEWSTKNSKKPAEVHLNSNKKFWFDCKTCGHELELLLRNINSGGWCAYCNRGKLCNSEECIFCFSRSLASHPMGQMWSNRNRLSAREVSRGNDKKFWFCCTTCKHEYDSVPYSMTEERSYCPYCTHQKLCEEDCKMCYEMSCASHERMSAEWSATNPKTPRQVFLQSNHKYGFDCRECHHSFQINPNHYTRRDKGCPYCANIKLCEAEDCIICFNKSFASHPRMACWSPKNELNPRRTFKGSNSRAIFQCDKCATEFDTRLYNVLTGYWCPGCKNKSESKVLSFLRSESPKWKAQLRYDWCRFSGTNNVMPFDFGLEEEKVLIELDGIQHFEQVSNWRCHKEIREKDVEKIRKAMKAGYSVIHLYQPEVWEDRYDWKRVLKEQVERLIRRETSVCLFISQKEVYDTHIQGMDGMAYEVIQP